MAEQDFLISPLRTIVGQNKNKRQLQTKYKNLSKSDLDLRPNKQHNIWLVWGKNYLDTLLPDQQIHFGLFGHFGLIDIKDFNFEIIEKLLISKNPSNFSR